MSNLRAPGVVGENALNAERCIVELQRGREVILASDTGSCVVRLVETINQALLKQITHQNTCQLVITRTRAAVLGYNSLEGAAVLNLSSTVSLPELASLSGLAPWRGDIASPVNWQSGPQVTANAALNLVKSAAVLPALLCYQQPAADGVLSLSTNAASDYLASPALLVELSGARVPLATAAGTSLRVFRELHGNAEHVAITVGEPDWQKPIDVRVHSSCFTGDILGSLKCDCGEQLQGAISSMANADGGVVLYISQEGRGIGLASKLRAYQLQAEGLDTIEANQHLGFVADARQYQAAASMLQAMNIERIRLITNNPDKIDALRAEGIDVIKRLPSAATINAHNARYLETKRIRAGHLSMESVG